MKSTVARGKSARISDETRDQLVFLLQKGMRKEELARIFEVSVSIVETTRTAYRKAEARDMDWLRKAIPRNEPVVRWACEKHGIDISEVEQQPEQEAAELPPAEPVKQDTADMADIEAAIHVAAAKLQVRQEEMLCSVLQKLDQIATIIQSCSVDQTKWLQTCAKHSDANADIIQQTMRDCATNLELIKKNTRPVKRENSGR